MSIAERSLCGSFDLERVDPEESARTRDPPRASCRIFSLCRGSVARQQRRAPNKTATPVAPLISEFDHEPYALSYRFSVNLEFRAWRGCKSSRRLSRLEWPTLLAEVTPVGAV